MLALIVTTIFSGIVVGVLSLFGVIPDGHGLKGFFALLLLSGRILNTAYLYGFRSSMRELLDRAYPLEQDERALLLAGAGVIYPQIIYKKQNFAKVDCHAHAMWLQVIAFIFMIVSLWYRNYIYALLALTVLLTGTAPWSPSRFCMGVEEGDALSVIMLYLKTKGKRLSGLSEFEKMQVWELYKDAMGKLRFELSGLGIGF